MGKALYPVSLSPTEREQLQQLIRREKRPAHETARARILLKTDEVWSAPQVADALNLSEGAVFRVKRRFSESGLEAAIKGKPGPQRPMKLD